jgi:hypothetical protein
VNLTAENTAIVLDSTADFPDASEHYRNWRVVPLYVNFGTDSYKDGVELTAHEFYERLRASPELPTTSTSAPPRSTSGSRARRRCRRRPSPRRATSSPATRSCGTPGSRASGRST